MKTIKVFLASSDELAEERIRFGNFIRHLDDMYEVRGYRIKLYMWEDLPSGDNGRPKQDEYNDKVRECDMFVGLFHTKAGKYTLEEYDTAKITQESTGKPTLYVFCRELAEGEHEEPELTEFKSKLLSVLHHYWNKYSNSDSLQLQFTLQLLKVENSRWDDLKVENGRVQLAEIEIAQMDNLPFAAGNKGYQKMKEELELLPTKIEKMRQRVKKYPDDEDFRDELQALLNRYNTLQEEFADHQKNLFATVKRIAEMQLEKVSSELRRAITEFESGRVEAANAILDSIEREADRHMEQLDHDRTLVHQDIEALQLKTKTLMADLTIPIEQRIQQTWDTYQKADDWAERSALPKEKQADLLYDFGDFLYRYAMYDEALKIKQRECRLYEDLYGHEHLYTAISYNNIGLVYNIKGNYDKALEYLSKALEIIEKVRGTEHPQTAASYCNLGLLYSDKGDYDRALKCYQKALAIEDKQAEASTYYVNIGVIYYNKGDYDKALFYFRKALTIEEESGTDHRGVATSYNNIGSVYKIKGDYNQALAYYEKALEINEKELGKKHPKTATNYNNIGSVYETQGDHDKAMDYYMKDLQICEEILGTEHPDTAGAYNNIGILFYRKGNLDKALEYALKALKICEKTLEPEHPNTATSYSSIGTIYSELGEHDQALAYYMKALKIEEKVLGTEHPDTAKTYNNIGLIYHKEEDYEQALAYYHKAIEIKEKVQGSTHPDIAVLFNNIGWIYINKSDYEHALNNFQQVLRIREKTLGTEHPLTKVAMENVEILKAKIEALNETSN